MQIGESMSARSERLAIVQALATEHERRSALQIAHGEEQVKLRQLEREASIQRVERLTNRLRELLPDGMTLGDYLGFNRLDDKQTLQELRKYFTGANGDERRKRRARRIF